MGDTGAGQKDYYSILGIDQGASDEAIRKAFRAKALELHPDKHKDAGAKAVAEVKFKDANEAYRILSDPDMRRRYDAGELSNDGFDGGPVPDLNELLRTMFFTASPGAAAAAGMSFVVVDDDLETLLGSAFNTATHTEHHQGQTQYTDIQVVVVPITLADVCSSKPVKKKVKWSDDLLCSKCNGYGVADPNADIAKCMTCGGRGHKCVSFAAVSMHIPCVSCGGRGSMTRRGSKPCKTCNGCGRVKVQRKTRVYIPRGCRSGQELATDNGVRFVASYQLEPHTQVVGNDVHVRVSIGLYELLTGFNKDLDVCGARRTLKSKAYFDTTVPKQIPKAGLPDRGYPENEALRGDIYVHWDLVLPPADTKEAACLRKSRRFITDPN